MIPMAGANSFSFLKGLARFQYLEGFKMKKLLGLGAALIFVSGSAFAGCPMPEHGHRLHGHHHHHHCCKHAKNKKACCKHHPKEHCCKHIAGGKFVQYKHAQEVRTNADTAKLGMKELKK